MAPSDKPRHLAQLRGQRAEWIARLFLRCQGYHIWGQNLRTPQGEIDILAARGQWLIAVEVKRRRDAAACAQAVGTRQQQRIARALEAVLTHPHIYLGKSAGLAASPPPNIRFDVLGISPFAWPLHIKDAWRIQHTWRT